MLSHGWDSLTFGKQSLRSILIGEDADRGRTFWYSGKVLRPASVSDSHLMEGLTVRLMHQHSIPISLRVGIRADVRGDSQRRDGLDVASHPGQQPPVLVHRLASTALTFAPLAEFIFVRVVRRRWLCAWEPTLSSPGARLQWARVVAGRVRTVSCTAVPWSATDIIRTSGGTGGDHPRVG